MGVESLSQEGLSSISSETVGAPITIRGNSHAIISEPLFKILGSIFATRFIYGTLSPNTRGIVSIANAEDAQTVGFPEVPTLFVDHPSPESKLGRFRVRFSANANVPYPFKGESITTDLPLGWKPLRLRPKEEILAETDEGPLWVISHQNSAPYFRSAFGLPVLSAEGSLNDIFNERRFLELLFLITFLRKVALDEGEFKRPDLRACFMFDDPNLHWPNYGFVDYREMAERAKSGGYHVSFATIPLDAWFTHSGTARIFVTHPEQLSLLFHGNNHVRTELARNYTSQERNALLMQARKRIERLEKRFGLQVSRVMVPPHGACSAEMLEELPRCGFEAACISHGSLRAYNPGKKWTQAVGYRPSETVEGCPVIPRMPFSSPTTAILLAAFCDQPIVLRGHHDELRGGLELLDQHARFVNGLGNVRWSDVGQIARSNYQTKIEGDTLQIRSYSSRFLISVPTNAREIHIESPGNHQFFLQKGNFKTTGINRFVRTEGSFGQESAKPDQLEFRTKAQLNGVEVDRSFSIAPWPLFRRVLTEGRDRLATIR